MADFEDGRKVQGAKECRWFLEAGKDKEIVLRISRTKLSSANTSILANGTCVTFLTYRT